jgi:hypothetical protein
LVFDRLPSLDQTKPERPVAVIPGGSRKTAAFVGAPFEFVMAPRADDSEREILNGGVSNGGVSVEHVCGLHSNERSSVCWCRQRQQADI